MICRNLSKYNENYWEFMKIIKIIINQKYLIAPSRSYRKYIYDFSKFVDNLSIEYWKLSIIYRKYIGILSKLFMTHRKYIDYALWCGALIGSSINDRKYIDNLSKFIDNILKIIDSLLKLSKL